MHSSWYFLQCAAFNFHFGSVDVSMHRGSLTSVITDIVRAHGIKRVPRTFDTETAWHQRSYVSLFMSILARNSRRLSLTLFSSNIAQLNQGRWYYLQNLNIFNNWNPVIMNHGVFTNILCFVEVFFTYVFFVNGLCSSGLCSNPLLLLSVSITIFETQMSK